METNYIRFLWFLQLEYMHCFCITRATEKHRVHTESQTAYRYASFNSATKLKQFCTIVNLQRYKEPSAMHLNLGTEQTISCHTNNSTYMKNSNYSTLLGSSSYFGSVRIKLKRCQWAVVRRNHSFSLLREHHKRVQLAARNLSTVKSLLNTYKINRVKYLNLSDCIRAWIG